jgi:hypothetical protein
VFGDAFVREESRAHIPSRRAPGKRPFDMCASAALMIPDRCCRCGIRWGLRPVPWKIRYYPTMR